MKKRISVMITGIGGGGVGEQVAKALRNGKNSYFIIGTDSRRDSIGCVLSDKFYLVPFANDENYIDKVIEICKENQCEILIPGSEPELMVIVKSIKRFEEAGLYVPVNQKNLIDLCSNKIEFNNFLVANNFNTCETHLISEQFDIDILKNYPYVIKPVSGSGSKNVFIVQDKNELLHILNYLGRNINSIIQEYVGSGKEEFTVGILSSQLGYVEHIILQRDLTFGLSVKQSVKNRTSHASLGSDLVISTGISQGTFVENDLISEVVHKLVNLLKPTSTINMQCRIHNDKVFIFEVNPRFSGTTNLRTLVGFNEPEYLINSYLSKEQLPLNSEKWVKKTVLRGIQEYLIN